MKVKEIQNRLERGYTNSIYGTSANTHEQMTNDIKTLLEVIFNTRCCETLKDKEKLSFKDWKFSKGLRYVSGHTYKDSDKDLYDSDEIEKMYEHYLNL